MKKFNLQFSFFLCFIFLGCILNENNTFLSLNKHTIDVNKGINVFYFVNTECPISQKYQGTFKELFQLNSNSFLVFPGNQTQSEIDFFLNYDSILPNNAIWDKDFKLSKYLKAQITPQVIITLNGLTVYSGLIDNRFKNIGTFDSNPDTNFVKNALISLNQDEKVAVPHTYPVGCFIEPH